MKTALITGSAKRIGRALALALAADGYDLYLHYHRSAAEAANLTAEIGSLGGKAEAITANLADAQEAQALVSRCTGLGPITCLVNNAASYQADDIRTMTVEGFDRQMGLNLRTPLLLAQAFAAQLPAGVEGAIINLLDFRIAALPSRFLSYTLAKAGLAAATEMLALTLAPGIRVCGIAPGLVLPGDNESGERFTQLQGNTLLRRGVETGDIVNAMRYLLSARSVTGQTIMVDAGQRLISQRKPQSTL